MDRMDRFLVYLPLIFLRFVLRLTILVQLHFLLTS